MLRGIGFFFLTLTPVVFLVISAQTTSTSTSTSTSTPSLLTRNPRTLPLTPAATQRRGTAGPSATATTSSGTASQTATQTGSGSKTGTASNTPSPGQSPGANTSTVSQKAASSTPQELNGDYIPCRFTPAELQNLHAPQISPTLSDAEAERLKDEVGQAALAASQSGQISEALAEEIITHVGATDFNGLTQSQALAKMIQAISDAKTNAAKPPQPTLTGDPAQWIPAIIRKLPAYQQNQDNLDKALKSYQDQVSQILAQAKDPNAGINGLLLGNFITFANRNEYSALKPFIPQVTIALGASDLNAVVQAARAYLGRLARPSDVFCGMSILSPEETSRAYGYIISRSYIAVQVMVRNLNPDQEFVLHDVEYAVNTDPTGTPGRFFSGRDKVIVRALSNAQASFDPRNITIGAAQGVGALFSAVASFTGGNLVSASGVVNGSAVPWLQKVWRDESADQLNLLNDTGFSSSVSSQTRVPTLGSVVLVTFIPSKQFSEAWWAQPCASYQYLLSRHGKLSLGPSKLKSYSPNGNDEEINRALEACGAMKDNACTTAGCTGARCAPPADPIATTCDESADPARSSVRSFWKPIVEHGILLKHGNKAPTFLQVRTTPDLTIQSITADSDSKSSYLAIKDFPLSPTSTPLTAVISQPHGDPPGDSYHSVTITSKAIQITPPLKNCAGGSCGTIAFLEETDIFRNMKTIDYWHWKGHSLQLFANLSLVVVAGTHVLDQTQLDLSITQLTCPQDDTGNVVFPNPLPAALNCTLTGKNLNKAAKLRLRNAKDATDTTVVDGTVSVSGDATRASVAFPAEGLICLPQSSYAVFAVSSAGVEQSTTQTLHFPVTPYAKSFDPPSLDFSDNKAHDLALSGCNLGSAANLELTASGATSNKIKASSPAAPKSVKFSISASDLSALPGTATMASLSVLDGSGKATPLQPTLGITNFARPKSAGNETRSAGASAASGGASSTGRGNASGTTTSTRSRSRSTKKIAPGATPTTATGGHT